jgi:CHAP domain-containing protein
MRALLRLGTASVAAMLLACGNTPGDESLGAAQQALNACDETVPTTRAVDGFPAYAQCNSIEDGAIWSNNGIDTAASSQGADWVRTQYSGGYQCTEFARRYFLFHWGIDYQHGNAGEWCDGTLPSTLVLATTPTHGDLIVFAPGSCGADSTTGHIAVVDTVDMAGAKVTIVEQNQASRRSTQQSCGKCFLHAVKNDGSVGGSGGAASGGAASGGAASGGAASGGVASGGAASGGVASGGAAAAGAGHVAGGAPSAAGSTSGGTSGGGAASSSGAVTGDAGFVSSSGTAPVGAAAGSSAASGNAGSPGAISDTAAADDAGCSVGRVGADGGAPGGAALFLAGFLLVSRRRRHHQTD